MKCRREEELVVNLKFQHHQSKVRTRYNAFKATSKTHLFFPVMSTTIIISLGMFSPLLMYWVMEEEELTNQTLERYIELTQILKSTATTPSTTSSSSTFPFTKATDTQQPANSSADDANNVFDIPQCRQSSSIFISNPMGTSTNSSSKSTSKKSSKTSKSSSPGGSSRSTPSTNNNVDEEIHLEDPQVQLKARSQHRTKK